MNSKNPGGCPNFIPYDDENLEQSMAGPDYGQPWSSSHAWNEIQSKEYPDFVAEIHQKMLSNRIRMDSD